MSGLRSASSLDHQTSGEDDWLTIPQKKDKKKKKQRAVPLQDFFSSENGGREYDSEYGTRYREEETELSHDEEVVAASLHSYFGDLLKRLGPLRMDDPRMVEAMDSLDAECRKLLDRFPTVSHFLSLSDDLAVVDNYVCVRADVTRALGIAVETIVNNAMRNPTGSYGGSFASRLKQQQQESSSRSSSPGSSSFVKGPPPPPRPTGSGTPPPSVWTSQPHAKTASESLFSKSSVPPGMLPQSRFVTPADITVPPPPIVPKSFIPVVGSSPRSGFGTIGSVVPAPSCSHPPPSGRDVSHMQDVIDNLNKRILGLTRSNSDLLQQVTEREKQVQRMSGLLSSHNELIRQNEQLKVKLRDAQKELQQNDGNEKKSPTTEEVEDADGHMTDSQLLIRLQNRLESEKLNSFTLKQQLEIERAYSSQLADRQALAIHNAGSSGGMGGLGGGLGGGGGLRHNNGYDSLGLRSLLGNISPMSSHSILTSTSSLGSANVPMSLGGSVVVSMAPITTAASQLGGGVGAGAKLGLAQIMRELKMNLPHVKEEDLHHHLAKLKRDHGQLSALALSRIVELVSLAVKRPSLTPMMGI
jgi:hypothetical protein